MDNYFGRKPEAERLLNLKIMLDPKASLILEVVCCLFSFLLYMHVFLVILLSSSYLPNNGIFNWRVLHLHV